MLGKPYGEARPWFSKGSGRHVVDEQHDPADSDERDNSVAPEVLLLGILAFAAWMSGLYSVGYAVGWGWMVFYFVASVAALFLWGSLDTSVSPAQQRRAERDRQLADLDADIEHARALQHTAEEADQDPQVIQDLLQGKVEVHRAFREADRAERRTAAWRSQPISRPRRVLRRIAQTVLVLAMILLAVAWYGAMVILLPALLGMALYPVMGLWALLPAGLVLPLGIWCAWWWIRRAPRSVVQAAGVGAAGGS
ncbi:hypothetical protein GCM10027174_45650 [Salinifilum aidingensis]